MNEISCLVKPDIWSYYRSFKREPPVSKAHAESYWYEYIQLPGGVWVTRDYEWEIVALHLGLAEMPGIRERYNELLGMVSAVQSKEVKCIGNYVITAPQVDYNKRILLDLVQYKNTLKENNGTFVLGVIGNSKTLQKYVSALSPDVIISSDWSFPSDKKVSIRSICKGSFPVLTEPREISVNEEEVGNWSTIRVLQAEQQERNK